MSYNFIFGFKICLDPLNLKFTNLWRKLVPNHFYKNLFLNCSNASQPQ